MALGGITPAAASPAASPPATARRGDPTFTVAQATLDAALECPDNFTHRDKEPVLLVHGTFTNGHENWDWTYKPLLAANGFDVCVVTYPDRGLGDMQVASEYVVNAVHRIYAATHHKVGIVGHSQGGLEPRWAIKWWPSVQREVADYVGLASPNHGTTAGLAPAGQPFPSGAPLPASIFQMEPQSHFITALNAGDETPGTIAYTDIYSAFYDELVQPATPVPTAGLDFGQHNPRVANIKIQDVCPGRFVDHISIIIDKAVAAWVIDALSHDGPANPARAGGAAVCGNPLTPWNLSLQTVGQLVSVMPYDFSQGFSNLHLVTAEPPLASYATR